VCVFVGREYRDISDRGVVVGNKGVISTTAVKKKMKSGRRTKKGLLLQL
jgi:hypothetical protein